MKLQDFAEKKRRGERISMVTSYDAWSARLIAATDVDCLLVGDSVAMVVHGHDTTLPADVPMMALHTAAVRRGAPDAFVVGDLPFLSCRGSLDRAVESAGALMRAGASAIKLEGAAGNLETIRYLVESGIPVMGHLGLTPQSVHKLGGFRVQGRDEAAAGRLRRDARDLQEAGCFAIVLEAVPAVLAAEVTQALQVPTIGIGAGAGTDGQVLVLHDLLGLEERFRPRFVRRFMDGGDAVRAALQDFHDAVVAGRFPGAKESYE